MELGGNEILNSARVVGYMSDGDCPVNWIICPPCDGVADANGDEPYTLSRLSEAPWYDVEYPASHRFYGAHTISVEGIDDSTREASIAEGIMDGGVVGNVRHAVRRVRVRALLSGRGEDAIEAGLGWLKAALDPDSCGIHGNSCGAVDSCFYAACPPARSEITMPETRWNDPITNLATNPSMETAGAAVAVRTNLATNPSFEAATAATVEVARNKMTNPSFRSKGPSTAQWTNLATNPSFEQATAATVEVRRNLALSPQAATDGVNAAGWNLTPQALVGAGWATTDTIAVATTVPGTSITTCYRRTFTAVGATVPYNTSFAANRGRIPVVAGESYVVSLWVRQGWAVVGTAPSNNIKASFYDAAGNYAGVASGTHWQPNTQWTRLWHSFTVPAGATQMDVTNDFNLPASTGWPVVGSTIEATGLLVEKQSGNPGSFFDGSTLPAGDFTHAWTGTANASASVQYGTAVPTVSTYNHVANIQSTEWAKSGSRSLRVMPLGTDTDTFGAVGGDSGGLRLGMVPGRTYTVMATVRIPAPQTGAAATSPRGRAIRVFLISPTLGQSETGPQAPNVAGIYELRHTFTLPADANQAFIRLYAGAAKGSGDVWFDNFLLVEGTYTGPYFDGSTPAKVRRNLALTPQAAVAPVAGWNINPLWSGGTGWSIANTPGVAVTIPGTPIVTAYRKQWTTVGTSAPNDISFQFNTGQRIPVTAGETYTISFYIRASWSLGTTSDNRIFAQFYDAVTGGTEIGVAYSPAQLPALVANEWQRYSYTVTIPAGAVALASNHRLYASGGNWPIVGSTLDATGLLVERDVGGVVGKFFDGATTSPVDGWDAAWEGAANASPSYLYDNDFTYAWTGTPNASTSERRALAVPGNFSNAGEPSNKWYISDGGATSIVSDTSTGGGRSVHIDGFVVGRVYTVLIRGRKIGVNSNLRFRNVWESAPLNWTDTMTDYRYTFTALVDGRLYLENSQTAGVGFEVERILLVQGTYTGPYFDGSTVPTSPDLTNAWVGVVDASESVKYGTAVTTIWGGGVAWVSSTEWASSGAKSLRVIRTATGDAWAAVSLGSVVGGKTYTVMVRSRVPAPLVTAGDMHVYEGSSPYRNLATLIYGNTTLNGVQDWRVTFTTPADLSPSGAILDFRTGATVGDSVWYDDVLVVEGTYTGPYFDGSTPAKVRRNRAYNPTSAGANSWSSNNDAYWTVTRNVPVPVPHPQGITVAAKSQHTGPPDPGVLSIFNADGLLAGPARYVGAWLLATSPGYEGWVSVGGVEATRVPLTPNVWRWAATATPSEDGGYMGVFIQRIDRGDAPAADVGYATGATAFIEAPPTEAVWGDMAPVNGLTAHWEGTPNETPSYLTDPDFTYAWTGTANASTSEQRALSVAPLVAGRIVSNSAAIQSSVWSSNRAKSMRLIPRSGDSYYQLGDYNFDIFQRGKTYTVSVVAHLEAPQTAAGGNARSLLAVNDSTWTEVKAQAPNVAGSHPLSITFTVPASGGSWQLVRLYTDAPSGGGDVWWDDLLIVEGEYPGDYFDGSFPDSTPEELATVGKQVVEYEWTGTPDASTSTYTTGTVIAVEDPVTWTQLVSELNRRLHNVTCISGPLIEQKFNRDGVYGMIVEFTLAAATPWVFSDTKPVILPPGLPVVVQDVPFNLVPYPSAEIESGTVIAATNYSTNPSVEVDATAWSTDGTINPRTIARSTELWSVGTASAKVTASPTVGGTNGWYAAEHTIDLPVLPAGTRMSFNEWASGSVESGTAVLGTLDIIAVWFNGATYLTESVIGSGPASGGAKSYKSIPVPVGANKVLLRAKQNVTSWNAGAILRLYADAATVSVP